MCYKSVQDIIAGAAKMYGVEYKTKSLVQQKVVKAVRNASKGKRIAQEMGYWKLLIMSALGPQKIILT